MLGDPAQLPPVEGAGFFTDFSTPEVMLTEIHRQAQDNPIIQLATTVRTGGKLKLGSYNGRASVIDARSLSDASLLAADQIICGTNKKRQHLNRQMRQLLGRGTPQLAFGSSSTGSHSLLPVVGDRVICLRNRHDRGMFNGSLWNISAIKDRSFSARKKGLDSVSYLRVASADEEGVNSYCDVLHNYWLGTDKELTPKEKRGYDEFTYGYAVTCHKSQGSQWDKVLVFDESWAFREDAARWLYTAVTRAAEKLIVVM